MSKGDLPCKLILLGNGSVGKTSIIQRFTDDGFQKVYKQTVGLDFFEKQVEIRQNLRMTLQVWDIGGQSISSQMLPNYVFGSQVIFLCYDVTDPQSFSDIEDWLTLVRNTFVDKVTGQKMKTPKLYLVGNKVDLIHLRKIDNATHTQFEQNHKLDGGFTMSAQSGENVLKVFYQCAAESVGVKLSNYELAFTEKVLTANIVEQNEGRTAMADQIEREDAEAAALAAKKAESSCQCAIS